MISELYQREHFLARIKSGYVRIKINDKAIRIYGPNEDIEYEAAELYTESYENSLNDELLTDKDIYNILLEQGLWTEQNEKELNEIVPNHIEYWKIELFNSLLKSNTHVKIRKYLQAAKDELNRLNNIRHAYDYATCHGLANFVKNQFIVKVCSYYNNVLIDWNEFDLNVVMNEYYKNLISQDILRSLVINTPWTNEWPSFKAANKIFNNNCLTSEQKSLVGLSCMYDKIYESPDCPSDEVIQDIDMLDGWLAIQRKKAEKERKRKETESQLSSNARINNADELFIPVETITDARRIYELNDTRADSVVTQRLKKVKEKGSVKYQDFDDVQQSISMDMTNAYRNKMKGGR